MSDRRLRYRNATERDERRNSGGNIERDTRNFSPLPGRRNAEGRNDADDVNSNDSGSETDEEDDDNWQENAEDENDQDDEMATNRSILWLCQEGQLRLALHRFDNLKRQDQEKLKKEIFQIGRDQNTALHEILMGGTTERSSYRLAFQLVEHCRKHYPQEFRQSLSIRPPSHRRTPLHWAAWGNAELNLVRFLALANPDALLMDDADGRTPYQIFNRYFSQVRPTQDMLFRMTKGWKQSLIRRTIQKCVIRYFLQQQLRPFDKTHRQQTGIKPKPWFVLSILGILVQSEMRPLYDHILAYSGGMIKERRLGISTRRNKSQKRKRAVEEDQVVVVVEP